MEKKKEVIRNKFNFCANQTIQNIKINLQIKTKISSINQIMTKSDEMRLKKSEMLTCLNLHIFLPFKYEYTYSFLFQL